MTLVTILMLAVIALLLVVLNFGLQRWINSDREYDSVTGCCGMALPTENIQSRLKEE